MSRLDDIIRSVDCDADPTSWYDHQERAKQDIKDLMLEIVMPEVQPGFVANKLKKKIESL